MPGLDFTPTQRLALYVLIGLCAAGLSYAHFARSRNSVGSEIVFRENTESESSAKGGKVVCHVTGCVNRPGVYTLEAGQRIIDAIKTAGGAKPNANLDALNLAQKVEDGSKIEVPEVLSGAVPSAAPAALPYSSGQPTPSPGGRTSSAPAKLSSPGQGVVHINSAGLDELQRLPGVGPATAQKILDYRRSIGAFRRTEQIMDVSGIGPKKYEKMRPFLAL